VLAAPPRRIGGIDDDHVQARVGGHLHETVAEPGGRDAHDRPAERPAAAAAGGPAAVLFAALGAGFGEVKVLNHDRSRTILPRGGDEASNCGAQPTVPGGGG